MQSTITPGWDKWDELRKMQVAAGGSYPAAWQLLEATTAFGAAGKWSDAVAVGATFHERFPIGSVPLADLVVNLSEAMVSGDLERIREIVARLEGHGLVRLAALADGVPTAT